MPIPCPWYSDGRHRGCDNAHIDTLDRLRAKMWDKLRRWIDDDGILRAEPAQVVSEVVNVAMAPAQICSKCKNTGHYEDDPDSGAQVYCECPIGEAFSAAWMGTGNEEETEAAIENMRVFMLRQMR